MSKRFLAGLVLSMSAVTLAACGDTAEEVAEAPEGIEGLTVENARLVLAPVAGNPAAVYLDLTYDGERGLSLSRVSVQGAESAVMHEYGEFNRKVQMMEMLPVALTKGTQVSFKPGEQHIMAMGVSPELKPGGTTEVTLIVSGGDKQTVTADIVAAGGEREIAQ
ncbi:copper chaperone PCu(A)C [Pontixanthobacter sp.]|uniref:copper chaperone PCu(A)C n=1 Tax=Pontixanthobacter sp. TaxID=2792078 RepID=UPI003C7CA178